MFAHVGNSSRIFSRTIVIGNLPCNTQRDDLYDTLSKHCTIVNLKIAGEKPGFGFATLHSSTEAVRFAKELNLRIQFLGHLLSFQVSLRYQLFESESFCISQRMRKEASRREVTEESTTAGVIEFTAAARPWLAADIECQDTFAVCPVVDELSPVKTVEAASSPVAVAPTSITVSPQLRDPTSLSADKHKCHETNDTICVQPTANLRALINPFLDKDDPAQPRQSVIPTQSGDSVTDGPSENGPPLKPSNTAPTITIEVGSVVTQAAGVLLAAPPPPPPPPPPRPPSPKTSYPTVVSTVDLTSTTNKQQVPTASLISSTIKCTKRSTGLRRQFAPTTTPPSGRSPATVINMAPNKHKTSGSGVFDMSTATELKHPRRAVLCNQSVDLTVGPDQIIRRAPAATVTVIECDSPPPQSQPFNSSVSKTRNSSKILPLEHCGGPGNGGGVMNVVNLCSEDSPEVVPVECTGSHRDVLVSITGTSTRSTVAVPIETREEEPPRCTSIGSAVCYATVQSVVIAQVPTGRGYWKKQLKRRRDEVS